MIGANKKFVGAVRSGDVAELRALMDRESPPMLEWEGHDRQTYTGTVLHCAAYYNQPAVIEYLVKEREYDPNTQRHRGKRTPLHQAEVSKACEAAAMLLELGANPDLQCLSNEWRARYDTTSFCASTEVAAHYGPVYREKLERQKKEEERAHAERVRQRQEREREEEEHRQRQRREKIAGTWEMTSPVEIVHTHELPDSNCRLTDIFNFETRCWRAVAQSLENGGVSQNIVFFDDVPDREILHQACKKLNELGGAVDEDSIDRRLVRKGLTLKNSPF